MENLKVNDLVMHKRIGLCMLLRNESFGAGRYWLVKRLKDGEIYSARHESNLKLVARNLKLK